MVVVGVIVVVIVWWWGWWSVSRRESRWFLLRPRMSIPVSPGLHI